MYQQLLETQISAQFQVTAKDQMVWLLSVVFRESKLVHTQR